MAHSRLLLGFCSTLMLGLGAAGAAAGEDPAKPRSEAKAEAEEPMVRATIEEAVPVDAKSRVPAGWRVREINGITHWCRRQVETGSRVRAEDTCVTPDEYEIVKRDAQRMLDDVSRGARNPKGG